VGSHWATATAATEDRKTPSARPAGAQQPCLPAQDRREIQGHPRSEDYAAKSTVYHWLKRWSEEGVPEGIWRKLLSLLERGSIAPPEAEGELDLTEGSLDGSFVPSKRGVRQ
jgi:hypothetical protein